MKKIIFSLFLILLSLMPNLAEARIDIVPQKIVIGSRERSGEFTVLNLYNVKGNFRVEIVGFRQNENGVYESLDKPLNPAFDPEQIVRFSPRQFTLEAGGRQKIRLSLRKPADLPEGEYRFHVKATRLTQDDELKDKSGTINVVMNVGITIPVIIRHGNVISSAKIISSKFLGSESSETNKPQLNLTISREGNASAIGKIEVYWKPENGANEKVGFISNANVFTEIDKRNFKVPLKDIPYNKGKFLIRYSDEVNKGKVIDELTIER